VENSKIKTMKRLNANIQPIKVIDGTHDITEKDLARQNYYRLLTEQAAWNLTKQPKKRRLSLWA
jgi:hypothetical protein